MDRDAEGNCYFLRVEIVTQGPSYFVIFSDTTQLPPPFRIDNFSLVQLVFHQVSFIIKLLSMIISLILFLFSKL
jgi:hypothetical protein